MCHKDQTYPAETYTRDEVESIMGLCNRRYLTGRRNRALIALLYRTGLRISEALALRPVDIDFDNATVRVLHGKGDHARTVGIDDRAASLVANWIVARRDMPGTRLFCTNSGKPLSRRSFGTVLTRLGRKAGILKRVHPHGFRHTHAAELAREGMPINLIQKQLGHSNISVTSRYLDHVAPTTLIEAIRGREWS